MIALGSFIYFYKNALVGEIAVFAKDPVNDACYFFFRWTVLRKDCDFSYIGESKRCWASRRVEHDPARAASKESAIRQHAERTTHDIHPRYGQILERNETNYKRRIFQESLHSNIDKNSVNERMEFPRAYVPLLRSLGSQNKKQ